MNPILVSMEHTRDATASIKKPDSSVNGELERWICIMVLFCISIQRARTASGFFFSPMPWATSTICVPWQNRQSQLTASFTTCEWNIFRFQRRYSENCEEQRFGTVLILSQLILSSRGSGTLSAFKWDEIHLRTVTLQVSEK